MNDLTEILYSNTKVQIGDLSPAAISNECLKYGKNAIIIASKDLSLPLEFEAAFQKNNINTMIFDNINRYSTSQACEEIASIAKVARGSFVIGIGDDDVTNMAKSVALLGNNPISSSIFFLKKNKIYSTSLNEPLPLIQVPINYLTFSETNPMFSIIEEETKIKHFIFEFPVYPTESFLNGDFTKNNSLEKLKRTAFAAICIASNIYLTTTLKPHQMLILKKSIDLISENLYKLITEPNNITVKNNLFYASLYLSFIFQPKLMGPLIPLCEAFCSVYQHITKEIPCCVLGPIIMKEEINASTQGNQNSTQTINHLKSLAKNCNVISNLSKVGVRNKKNFEKVADIFFNYGSTEFFRNFLKKETIVSILTQAFNKK